MSLLDPTLDLVFKLLLTREPALLRDMLEAILGQTLREISIIDSDIPGERVADKGIILDIRAVLDDGSRADVEMQIRAPPLLRSRLVYYGARDYSGQLARGEGYEQLTPTAVIVWMVDPLFPELDRLHAIFELRERHTHVRFSDQLTIHVLQLRSLRRSRSVGEGGRVERWARFLTARSEVELEQLALEDPIMSLAKQTLEDLSQDPETLRRARERADAIKLYELDLAASRTEGRSEGRSEGEIQGRVALLLKQLTVRFGSPSRGVRARIEAATIEQLDAWAERVLTGGSLDEVLDEPSD